jgi:pimeloyl-ACP methyl ester carboxylesterase
LLHLLFFENLKKFGRAPLYSEMPNVRSRSQSAANLIEKALDMQPLKTLHYVESGNPKGETVFFLAGWPDDHHAWAKVIGGFSDYRCVVACMPDMDESRQRKPWGYRNDDLVALIAATVEKVSPDKPVMLILHDWGAHFGFQYQAAFPHKVSKVVGVDVGATIKGAIPGIWDILVTLTYQLFLACCYVMGHLGFTFLANMLTRFFTGLTFFAGPFSRDKKDIHWHYNYPYFRLWLDILTFSSQAPFHMDYTLTSPVLYIYGTAKICQFHTSEFVKRVEAHKDSSIVQIKTGHWVFNNKPKEFLEAVLPFLKA